MKWCVFCGSSPGSDPAFRAAARELGEALAREGMDLVYGGGSVGLMGEVARAVMRSGGKVTGIIPRALYERELADEDITELQIVASMHERKAKMAVLADGFIALPGGYGTLEEICEMITWVQLALHDKPCLLLNVNGYYDPLIAMFDKALESEFISPGSRRIVRAYATVEALVSSLRAG